MVLNCLETMVKIFFNPATQNQIFHKTVFNNAAIRRNAIKMNTNSAFSD